MSLPVNPFVNNSYLASPCSGSTSPKDSTLDNSSSAKRVQEEISPSLTVKALRSKRSRRSPGTNSAQPTHTNGSLVSTRSPSPSSTYSRSSSTLSSSPGTSPYLSGSVRLPFQYRIPGPGTKVICETASAESNDLESDSAALGTGGNHDRNKKPLQFIHNLAPEVVIPPAKVTVGIPYVQSPEARKQQLRRLKRDRGRVKRASNCFILYRIKMHSELVAKYGSQNNKEISRLAGLYWNAEPPQVKAIYKEEARREREQHALINPNYKYQPARKGKRTKMSDESASESSAPSASSTSFELYSPFSSSSSSSPFSSSFSSSSSSSSPSPKKRASTSFPPSTTGTESTGKPKGRSRKPKAPVSNLDLKQALSSMGNPSNNRALSLPLTSAKEDRGSEETILLSAPTPASTSTSKGCVKAKGSIKTKAKSTKRTLAYTVTEMPLHEFLKTQPAAPLPAAVSDESSSAPTTPSSKDTEPTGVTTSPLLLPTIGTEDPPLPLAQILNTSLDEVLNSSMAEASLDVASPMDSLDYAFSHDSAAAASTIDYQTSFASLAGSLTLHGGSVCGCTTCPHASPASIHTSPLSGANASHIDPSSSINLVSSPITPLSASNQIQPVGQPMATATTFKGPDGTTFVLTVIPQACQTPPTVVSLPMQHLSLSSCPLSSTSSFATLAGTPPCTTSSFEFSVASPFKGPCAAQMPGDMSSSATSSSQVPIIDFFDHAFAMDCSSPLPTTVPCPQQQQPLPFIALHEGVADHGGSSPFVLGELSDVTPASVPTLAALPSASPLCPSMLMVAASPTVNVFSDAQYDLVATDITNMGELGGVAATATDSDLIGNSIHDAFSGFSPNTIATSEVILSEWILASMTSLVEDPSPAGTLDPFALTTLQKCMP